ncbi:DUF6477 family protein [Pseudoruegeria sp. SK021]|uniref:DUF6477 family protein n=1 Tax=Pseudoruegeria sp. SK021 TaxID=1933035 RepID=UPI000A236301|nr:DUF6477 family protein [Pseudoruegeria sp. SK021]OSP55552.1 hypothetical protein BV911_06690 [Pseudoruegeria sp. SK021]
MTDVLTLLKSLHRPRLLVRAARFAQSDYRREIVLRRLLKAPLPAGSNEVVIRLLEIEAYHEETRQLGEARYSALRHIEVLAALMVEFRRLQSRVLPALMSDSAPLPKT